MRMLFFTVHDSAAGAFLEPFCAPTIEVAIRMFRQLVNRADHQFGKFPEDYTLFHVGEFDQESGALVGLPTPHSLGVAVTFVERGVAIREADSPEDAHGFVARGAIRDA